MSAKTPLRLAAALLLGILFFPEPASAQYFGRNKIQRKDLAWHILSTRHFDIHFYQGEEAFAARAGLVLEDGYRMLSAKLGAELPWKVPIILYASHNDFLETNVSLSLLSEGVQAFAEPSRRRIVLPFNGSFSAFRHTAIHELAHVFTFHIVYNRLMDNVFSRNYLFSMPLWLVEGLAEYLSVGWDTDSDMFIRDAVIYDYVMDLDYVNGLYAYKEGQSVMNYIADTYGNEKLLDILSALASSRNAAAALEKTIGVDSDELSRQWKASLRKHYWPLYAHKSDAEDIGRKLTDHVKDHGYYNTKPVLSPDGEYIAFFSDRGGLMDIYLMSALDGKVVRKLVSGYRSNRFESLHFFSSSISFSPDGSMIAFVAKSKGRDVVYLVRTGDGKIAKQLDVHADQLLAPAWSPDGNSIVLTAVLRGQTDLVLIDAERGTYKRLTNDVADQLTPRFFPDGKRIVFTCLPQATVDTPSDFSGPHLSTLGEMDFLADGNIVRDYHFDIYMMNLETGEIAPLIRTPGDDANPLVMNDGETVIFTSNESGINNLYAGDVRSGTYHRFTDVLGGLFTPDVNESKGRLTFSAFVNGGYDVHVTDDLKELMTARYSNPPAAVAEAPEADWMPPEIARASADTAGVRPSIAVSDSVRVPETREPALTPASGDSLPAPGSIEVSARKDDEGSRGATVVPYRVRFAPDFVGQGAGLYFSTGFGFGLSNTVALSDILGNHRAVFSFNIYRDITDSDFLLSYYYLKKRVDYAFGVFQFKNYLNSRMTSVGESFMNYRLFSEKNYGLFALMSIPITTFDRVDIEFEGFVSDREFYDRFVDEDGSGNSLYLPVDHSTRRLIEPSVAFVHDASWYSSFGPVDGSRWILSLSKGIAFGGSDVSRATAFADYRWYTPLFYRNSIAFRLAAAASEGTDPRTFYLGGPVSLRGYDFLSFEGSRMGLLSFEYRYPMIDALILGWPARWGFTNIGGTVFFDAGAAWRGDDFTAFKKDVRGLQFEDIKADYGFGMYLNAGFLLLNFQFAWPTDLHTVGNSQFYFYLGPAF
ncbi:MAG: PD40 domain-containing protein [Chitinivibrionia bacterium]|nr:PD40 domain-containing protein [Chitinivibrionia bacterium]